MQDKYVATVNGQEVQIADVNLIASEAALADDLVLAELLRLAPYGTDVARAVLPHGFTDSTNLDATVTNGHGTTLGGITVNAFRAVIGSRTGAPSATKYSDIRSALFTNASGTFNDLTISLPANAVASPQPFLVYATLFIDQNAATTPRYVKDPVTHNVTQPSLVLTKKTYVTVSVAAGAVGGAFPSLPVDPAGGFNIPLARVIAPGPFTSATLIPNTNIMDVSPSISLNRQVNIAPANQTSTVGSAFFAGTAKTKYYFPPSMVGKAERYFVIDTQGGAIPDGTVIDSSIDWRNRIFKVFVAADAGGGAYAWYPGGALPNKNSNSKLYAGSSFGNTDSTVVSLTNAEISQVSLGANVNLMVNATTGALYLSYSSSPSVSMFFWLDATAQFPNQ